MDSSYWPYIAIVLLIAMSAFFSGSEIAYASANKMRLKKNAQEKGGRDKIAYEISENYETALSSILIGNNLVNIAASSVATVIAMSIFGQNSTKGPAIATTVMTVLILIFGEIAPKIVAKKNCDAFSLAVALPLKLIMTIIGPVNKVVVWIVHSFDKIWGTEEAKGMTEEELVSIIELVEDEGVIDEEQSELLQSALEFSDITAQEVITPRVDMLSIDIDDDWDEIREKIFESPYSRIPVYRDTIDNIVGILYIDHFFKQLVDEPELNSLEGLLMPPCYIHKTMKLPAIVSQLRQQQMHLAIVLDEYGGTMGMVTLEDAIEQLVGDIWDETDEIISDITQTGTDTFIVSGDLSIYDFLEQFELEDDRFDTEYVTVGGWAIEMFDGYPEKNDSFEYQNLKIIIDEVDDLRITGLKVVVGPKPEPEDED
ncbi:MAG: HlyC/CorC family transporter [Clostridia bacterium]|nr:HlyC/CorC family transporter [Clostridia bacterium]MBQ2327133.1 HlyC/CorC family transporter [Clostridia bacterium]MBQ5814006.1 HlyC/CorC family transporter [Clostridia bacterium]